MTRNVIMVGLAMVCGLALAEEPGGSDNAGLKALTLKQEMVRDRFERFRERMFQLAEDLAEVEPENATRLARTIERAGELGLEEELTRVAELLGDSSSLAEALDRQEKWIVDAQRLMDILLEKDSLNEQRQDRMDELRAYKQKLDDILKEQRALRAQAGQAARAKRMLQQVEQAIKRLDAMLDRQKGVSQKTATQPTGGPSDRKELGAQQKNLSREAKVLSEDLKRLGDLKHPQEQSGEAPDSPKLVKAREAVKSAGKSVRSGAQSMSKAAENLEKNQPSDAMERQEQVEKQLEEARQKLKQARDALKQESKTAFSAGDQRATAQQTRQLRDKMKDGGSKGKSGSSGKQSSKNQQGKGKGKEGEQGKKQSGGRKQSEPAPGSENLDRAQRKMDDAAEKLEKENPDDATESQDQAIEELEEAQRELEDVLMQLRREERAEMLRDLEDRFRDLLLKQRAVNDKTVELDDIGRENFQRGEQLRLADLAAAERQLQAKAATCVHILEEEGTTIAFPRVVGQIAEDMGVVEDRLGRAYVGALTQRIEDEIVTTLEQLLEALKKMQQDNEQQSGQMGQPGGDKESPLLPASAELKLLRSSQARVNMRTNVIEERREQAAEPTDELAKAFKQAAGRQKDCAQIAEEMRDLADQ